MKSYKKKKIRFLKLKYKYHKSCKSLMRTMMMNQLI